MKYIMCVCFHPKAQVQCNFVYLFFRCFFLPSSPFSCLLFELLTQSKQNHKFVIIYGIFAILSLLILSFADGSRDDLNSIRCVCMIAASLLVIHGASKYKASCLVPILFAQVIDFAASA